MEPAKTTKATETTGLISHPEGTATGAQLTLNLVVCGLGTGILTLPWSLAGASLIFGVAIIAAVLVVNAWTILLLVEAAETYQVFDIGGLLAHLPGRLGHRAPQAVNAAIWVSGFLCLVSYVLVLADCGQPFLLAPSWRLKILVSLLVLPICFLDQRWLSLTSSLSVAAVGIVFWLLLKLDLQDHKAVPFCIAGISWGIVSMFASMMQTVVLQMCVLPMYGEMKDRSPGDFGRAVIISFTILFVVCAGFAVLGYAIFGPNVSSNVLLSLPEGDLGNVARLVAGASVVGVFPLILKSMIATFHTPGHSNEAAAHIGTGGIVAGVMLISLCFADLGKLNIVNGAVSTGVFVAVVPFLVGFHLLERVQRSPTLRVALITLLVLGVLGSVCALILDDNFEQGLESACFWKASK
eukprot:CAMPEP_0181411850 /NCGR_PEP_ID=MMETSP1110-20121109/8108_1 /TAXON_ID=174948 /ORGANISM="Symbiodinium sp., Strain CCMP421" /LENGTH=408 /DNA_ID=CAMNT_0023534523 /DNA_START=81 /DNA_END=1307 /DNA_ORIENTATION=+